ncbi:MAG: hypothetical protein G8237_09655 [Magnetococcales bacterium]|nr:hypothetical protein [Magnetococcales bacterium]NGZ06610.1 hypothetical protein [Magnetococcales bacterium]
MIEENKNEQYICPNCNAGTTQRYEVIHQSKTVHTGVGVGGGHLAVGVGVSQTLNGPMFSPPQMPPSPFAIGCGATIICFITLAGTIPSAGLLFTISAIFCALVVAAAKE